MTRIVDWIANTLRAEGVEFLSCYPTTALIDATTRAGIRPIVCRQERVGVGIADGFSRVAGPDRFGVFAMQYGPGAENSFSGVASAASDGIPLLLLPMGNALDRAQMRPLFSSAKAYAPITKNFETIVRPGDVADVMRRALTAVRNEPPGPVMVETPIDVALTEVPDDIAPHMPVVVARAQADPADIDRALELLLAAERPVILAGAGVLRAGASAELVRVAEALVIPVATTLSGKSAMPETHGLALGTASISASDVVVEFLRDADVVFAVGSSLTRQFLATKPPAGVKLIQLTADPRDLAKGMPVDHALVGDARLVLGQLLAAAEERTLDDRPKRDDLEGRIIQRDAAWRERWRYKLASDDRPITPYRVIAEFMRVTDPEQTIVTHDSGSPRDQIVPFYRSGGPNTYLGWGKSHSLGGGLGLIMGAKLAAPDKLCVQFLGDAAFGMTGLDVETAVRAEIPVVWVVLNNSTMAIETGSLLDSHERYAARDIGGDYTAIARALGLDAELVDAPRDLGPAFERARRTTQAGRPVLIEVITSAETEFSNRSEISWAHSCP